MTRYFLQSRLILLTIFAILLLSNNSAYAISEYEIRMTITKETADTNVPTSLAIAIAKVGSNFRPDYQGLKGARGVMQIMPEMAESMDISPADLWAPRSNIRLGLKILSDILNRTEGEWAQAISIYYSDRINPATRFMRQRIAKVLEWERRYAEQLALQDPREKRRRSVLAGENSKDKSESAAGRVTSNDDWSDTTPENFMEDSYLVQHGENPAQIIIFEYVPKHPVIIPGYMPSYRVLRNHPSRHPHWRFPKRSERPRWHPHAERRRLHMERRFARRMMRRSHP